MPRKTQCRHPLWDVGVHYAAHYPAQISTAAHSIPTQREVSSSLVGAERTPLLTQTLRLGFRRLLSLTLASARSQTTHPPNAFVMFDAERIAGCLAAEAPNIRIEVWPPPLTDGATTLRANFGKELSTILFPNCHTPAARVLRSSAWSAASLWLLGLRRRSRLSRFLPSCHGVTPCRQD
jgi:hypothetical protein